MTQLILGTAGHIDHGKTALIKALTNIDLDRLKEEKERGITIELGFASLDLPGDLRLGIVDVPGHEKFIKRMISGAGGVDIVVLVIAADDGVMPQTKEHLDICQLLNIQTGLVAITKVDLVDSEWLELVQEDITQIAKGTFLEANPIIPVSAVTGEGMPQLVSAIETIARTIDKRVSKGLCFLPVDRVFTMKGFGTVVTGTLISGELKVGNTLEVLPSGFQAKIRKLQVHNDTVEISTAGQRTAVNLQGIEKGSLKRGDILSHPGTLRPSYRFDVRLKLLAAAPHPLEHGDQVRLHVFTSQTLARIICYEEGVLEPGGTYNVQLRFSDPIVTIPGARFIIRNPDATRTLGGGEVFDPHPPKHRRSESQTKIWFQTFQDKTLEPILTAIAKTSGVKGITQKEILGRVHDPMAQLETTWEHLLGTKTLIEINPESHLSVHSETLRTCEQELEGLIKAYHQQNPLKPGMHAMEARHRLGLEVSDRLYEYLIQAMKQKGTIGSSGEIVYCASHKVALSPEQVTLKQDIEATYRSHGLTPPTLRELTAQFSATPEVLNNLLNLSVQEGSLLKVKDDLYFCMEHIAQLKKRLIEYFKENKELTAGDFKKMTNISRKYLIPLLEYFDREKITMRVGDKRLLRDGKSSG
jgi:selenocysteine-specific elongation factor